MVPMKRCVGMIATAGLALAACGGSGGDDASQPAIEVQAEQCVVHLHGKGGSGQDATLEDRVAHLRPSGNDEAWGGRQWSYFPDEAFAEASAIVSAAVDAAGCEFVVLNGFSNGAAFVAKLVCSGTTLDERLVGAVIDDPVADLGVADCSPAPLVGTALYWTGALSETAPPGTDCSEIDWTCEGDTVTDIDTYAAALGVEVTPSPFTDHEPYLDTPEPETWLALVATAS